MNRILLLLFLSFAPLSLLLLAESGAGGPGTMPGQSGRTPWTTSRVKGTPDPPLPYDIQLAFPQLKFVRPVEFASAPGSRRLFVAELEGKIYSFPNDPQCDRADLCLDLRAEIPSATNIYGLTFHPDFEQNRFVYLCYVLRDGDPNGTRVSRFRMTEDDPPKIDPKSETVIITWLAGGHNGGCLKFGPDGYLYISTGDAVGPSPPDTLDTGQDLGDLLGSILRIDVDHAEAGKNYRVPPDNPFVGQEGIRPENWAYGFRNPWKMSFHPATGDLWLGDVGWELWEMVYRIEPGGNYGWSIMEGRQPVRPDAKRGPTPIQPPIVDHPHSEAASVTGGYFYRGRRLPELAGAYIYGDFVTGKIWGLRYDGHEVTWHQELADTPLQIIVFGEDNDGELYIVDYEYTGQIYRLVKSPAAAETADFPRRLSETGLFRSVPQHDPAAGVVAYDVAAPLWSDYASADRLLALPGGSQIDRDKDGHWKYPDGAVLAKTLSLEMERGDPNSRRRIETQLLHFENNSWRPYTYVWNDDQSDAVLAEADGSERILTVRDSQAPGGVREQTWRFAARTECALCHNPWAGYVLGAHRLQMNRPAGGSSENQLERLGRLGLLAESAALTAVSGEPMADPYDASASLERRARSYLHANCAHCHRFGGDGTTTIQLAFDVPLKDAGLLEREPVLGAFGIPNAKVIASGNPYRSVLYYRMATLGGGRMPRAGSFYIDRAGLELIHDWIAELPGDGEADAVQRAVAESLATAARRPEDSRTPILADLLQSPDRASIVARAIDQQALHAELAPQLIATGLTHANPAVRGLFERFVADRQRSKKLGPNVERDALLATPGDPERGRAIFFSNPVARCAACHTVAGQGEQLGPDLSEIGQKYSRAELLTHLVDPSQKLDPEYVPYLIAKRDGEVLSGLLLERNADSVVLKDAENRTVRVPAADIEEMAAQKQSLMPEQLLQGMTVQEAADLLAFLASLR